MQDKKGKTAGRGRLVAQAFKKKSTVIRRGIKQQEKMRSWMLVGQWYQGPACPA